VPARPDRHPDAIDPHAAPGGLIEASMKSSISASASFMPRLKSDYPKMTTTRCLAAVLAVDVAAC
jgi:hypothetical protein